MSTHAILFDLDGTLVDSNEAHIDAWREAFLSSGHNVPPERIRPHVGKGGDKLVADILGADEDARIGAHLRSEHDANFLRIASDNRLRLYPGAIDLLETLRRRWLKTALVTSSKRANVEATFRSAGVDLGSRVDLVVYADHVENTKPAPDLLQAALSRLSLPPDACVFVGDTVHDAAASLRAEIPFIGLTCGRCADTDELTLAGAISVWQGPKHLKEHLDQALATAATVQPG